MTSPHSKRGTRSGPAPGLPRAVALHWAAALRHRADGPTAYPRWHPVPETAKNGCALAIPVHPILQAVLDDTPSDHLTFLTTRVGSPFTPAGFTNWFRECCNEAGPIQGDIGSRASQSSMPASCRSGLFGERNRRDQRPQKPERGSAIHGCRRSIADGASGYGSDARSFPCDQKENIELQT